LGWNVKDFKLYEDMTPEEREEHKEKRKNYGRDSLRYKQEEKQKLEEQLNNLTTLKTETIEKLSKDETVKEQAINKLEQQLKDDGTIQIEETYGHILLNFQNWQSEHPGEYYKKEDLITEEIKELLLNL